MATGGRIVGGGPRFTQMPRPSVGQNIASGLGAFAQSLGQQRQLERQQQHNALSAILPTMVARLQARPAMPGEDPQVNFGGFGFVQQESPLQNLQVVNAQLENKLIAKKIDNQDQRFLIASRIAPKVAELMTIPALAQNLDINAVMDTLIEKEVEAVQQEGVDVQGADVVTQQDLEMLAKANGLTASQAYDALKKRDSKVVFAPDVENRYGSINRAKVRNAR